VLLETFSTSIQELFSPFRVFKPRALEIEEFKERKCDNLEVLNRISVPIRTLQLK
jgi:hypothetical protein